MVEVRKLERGPEREQRGFKERGREGNRTFAV